MRRAWSALVVIAMGILCAAGARAVDYPIGADLLNAFERLPETRVGALPHGDSSHDRTGGNDDGFLTTYSELYAENGEHVLVDETGAGCVERMWFTDLSTSGNIRVYIDGATNPAIDMPLTQFVSGAAPGFAFPITGDDNASSGGFYSYVPICYRHGVRVVTTGPTHFYNIGLERFPTSQGVTSYTGTEDFSGALDDWNAVGEDPKPDDPAGETLTGALSIADGAEGVLIDRVGAGSIRSIRIKSDAPGEAWRDARLVVTFDGVDEPQVDAPVADFFVAADAVIDTHALPIGTDADGWWYVYFPMPFWQSVNARVVNDSGETLAADYELVVGATPYDIHAGHFHADGREAITELGSDYRYLEAEGRGHYVGSVVVMTGIALRYFLEGDERVYVNGSRSPAIYGTGTEDYYNAGWYFNRGAFTLPTHGNQGHASDVVSDTTACYRFHFADPIPFMDGMVFGIEHDFYNLIPGEDYASVAYWYGAPDSALMPAVSIDVGNANSEDMASYAAPDSTPLSVSSAFEGDQDSVLVDETGRTVTFTSRFVVPLPRDNNGVLLRRLTDAAEDGAAAKVFVDDALVGLWQRRGRNTHKRLLEDDFVVPESFTAGKRSINVRFEPQPGAPWIELAWTAFSIHNELPSRLASLAIAWEGAEPEKHQTVRILATGTYWDGSTAAMDSHVTWTVEGGEYTEDDGDFTPLSCGTYAITARAGDTLSNTLELTLCPDDVEDPPDDTPLTPPADEPDSAKAEQQESACCGM